MPTTCDLESCTNSRFQEVEAFKSQGSTKIGDAATSGWVEKTEPGQRHLCRSVRWLADGLLVHADQCFMFQFWLPHARIRPPSRCSLHEESKIYHRDSPDQDLINDLLHRDNLIRKASYICLQ
jgi:hypothetical protein